MRADERILGGPEFVERILKEAGEDRERKSRLRQMGIDLPQLVERIGAYFGLEIEDLKSGSKVAGISRARAVFCCVGAHKLGFPSVSISEELGVSPSALPRSTIKFGYGHKAGQGMPCLYRTCVRFMSRALQARCLVDGSVIVLRK